MAHTEDVFEDLVDEVVDAAQDVSSSLEWGVSVMDAEHRLQESRRKLREFFAEQMKNR